MDEYLHIFDFDYTLYKTYETIYVWSPRGDYTLNGNSCFRLNSQEYQHYEMAADEYVDSNSFKDFNKVDWNRAIRIAPTCYLFETVSKKHILTARHQCIDKYIKQKLPGEYKIKGLDSGDPERKIKYIKSLGVEKVIVYDDSYKVIQQCKKNNILCAYIQAKQKTVNIQYIL